MNMDMNDINIIFQYADLDDSVRVKSILNKGKYVNDIKKNFYKQNANETYTNIGKTITVTATKPKIAANKIFSVICKNSDIINDKI
jgi:hypothetical protein